MKKLLELLEENGVEVTGGLEEEIENIWPNEVDTADLFTQEDVNDIVKKRLGRENKLHEQEIAELKEKMQSLVDPEKVEEYEKQVEELEGKAKEREAQLKTEYELALAATEAGVVDKEYFDFLAEKREFHDKLVLNDEGEVCVTDGEGRLLTDDEGEYFKPSYLIGQLKEEKPEIFGSAEKEKKKTTGATNPARGDVALNQQAEKRRKRTKELVKELGYTTKKDGEN
ncbi:hypothetical protein [Halarsenatibacter silvermanii]|uniref:Phage minor structural protein GP20 n=1 Tax=Halarsenatibacter silvermanii TaxID=321763 RepID=A0A1G9RB82_9FIRM|nr:hypothetical protein [Halarsenatibacter silvermanii]SDM20493.1 hypothetical protein SAMN04488692_12125 [Halarsenatibacter silvermanii]